MLFLLRCEHTLVRIVKAVVLNLFDSKTPTVPNSICKSLVTFHIVCDLLDKSFYTLYLKVSLIQCKYTSGGPLSALTCCVNVRLLSAIKKISPLIYSQSWVGSWVYTTQAMMTFTLIF